MNHKEKTKHLESSWQKHIAQLERSDLSQKAYCDRHNLVAHQLSYWKKRLKKLNSKYKTKGNFSKLRIQPELVVSKPKLKFNLNLPNGIVAALELTSREDFLKIIRELASS